MREELEIVPRWELIFRKKCGGKKISVRKKKVFRIDPDAPCFFIDLTVSISPSAALDAAIGRTIKSCPGNILRL